MTHPCMIEFWGGAADVLIGNPTVPGLLPPATAAPRGWARMLPAEEWNALVTLKGQLEVALALAAAEPKLPWIGGQPANPQLLPTLLEMSAQIELDYVDTSFSDFHTPGTNGWIRTGPPQHGAVTRLTTLYGRVKNALDC